MVGWGSTDLTERWTQHALKAATEPSVVRHGCLERRIARSPAWISYDTALVNIMMCLSATLMHGKDKDWRDMDGLIRRLDRAGARRVEVDQKVGLNSVQSTSSILAMSFASTLPALGRALRHSSTTTSRACRRCLATTAVRRNDTPAPMKPVAIPPTPTSTSPSEAATASTVTSLPASTAKQGGPLAKVIRDSIRVSRGSDLKVGIAS